MRRLPLLVGMLIVLTGLVACGNNGGGGGSSFGDWTWIKGANVVNDTGNFGAPSGSGTYTPSARGASSSWIDSDKNLWFFGGSGYDSAGSFGLLNDLWRFNGSEWQWIKGSNLGNQAGTYGVKGTYDPVHMPGARDRGAVGSGTGDTIWLFGGWGYDSVGSQGTLNDLWRFDGVNWSWVSGANVGGQNGAYGIKGTADPANVPGSRYAGASWTASDSSFWVFGGYGRDSTGAESYLNDLWRFDGTEWTWISGSDLVDQAGSYGSLGVSSGSNVPGARRGAVSWIDDGGNFWMFGGHGYDDSGTFGALNDLWRFDGTNWTWMAGSNAVDQPGTYGTKGVNGPGNVPGARYFATAWQDANGDQWLFGGFGYDASGTLGRLNDLWRFDGTGWTWISGSDAANQTGIYGVEGVADATNSVGSRRDAMAWDDGNGNVWLFGGNGYDSAGVVGQLSDLWRYRY